MKYQRRCSKMELFKQIFTIGISVTVTFLVCVGLVGVICDVFDYIRDKLYERRH